MTKLEELATLMRADIERQVRATASRLEPEGLVDDREVVWVMFQALREPSEAMLEAAMRSDYPHIRGGRQKAEWQAMIEAILNETEGEEGAHL